MAHLTAQVFKLGREKRLGTVAERLVRLMVDFDHQPVGADRGGSPGQGNHLVAAAGRMAGIDDDGQMALLLDIGDGREVQRVATVVDKGANPALTEDDLDVAAFHDILRRHQPFVDGGGHAAFQHDRPVGAAGAPQQAEILHVARADLDHVGVFLNNIECFEIHHFGDHGQAGFVSHLGQDLQPLHTQPLEGIGRSARLESTAAEHLRAGVLDFRGNGQCLRFAFDGTGPGDQCLVAITDGEVADGNDGVFRLRFTADQLVGPGYRDDFLHPGQADETGGIHGALVTQHAYRNPVSTGDRPGFVTAFLDGLGYDFDLLRCRVFFHHDKHN